MTSSNGTTVEVSHELAKELIPILENQILGLENQVVSIQDEIDSKKLELAALKSKLGLNNTESDKRRLKRGEADGIIVSTLKNLPAGSGLSMKQIVERGKVPYSSVFRILKDDSKNMGRFIEQDGVWKAI